MTRFTKRFFALEAGVVADIIPVRSHLVMHAGRPLLLSPPLGAPLPPGTPPLLPPLLL